MDNLTDSFLKEKKQKLEETLPYYITQLRAPENLKKSMVYSLNAGGKRLRPILLFATIESFGGDYEESLPLACAIEMIHTYSLIHDDLPAMDNDDYRRGKLTNHKVFGDATAILAGDALLTYSFQLIANLRSSNLTSEDKLTLISELARAAGPEGMVGGQIADIEAQEKTLTISELEYIHMHKTGDLLIYSIFAGAVIAKADEQDIMNLGEFAKHLGLAFQIKDDILDIEGNEDVLGKPVGSDETNGKSTYPKLLSLDGSKQKLHSHIATAKEYLFKVKMNHTLLETLTDYILNRDH